MVSETHTLSVTWKPVKMHIKQISWEELREESRLTFLLKYNQSTMECHF